MDSDAINLEFTSEQAFLKHAARCLLRLKTRLGQPSRAVGNKHAELALERLRQKRLEAMDSQRAIAIGRIDFEGSESWHIGPSVIYDGNDPIVVSWAAPVAAPYFEATPDDPRGLRLRRRLRTNWDELLSFDDDDFGRGAKTPPVLDDLLLQELGRERTSSMSEVVATIQRDQYRMITLAESSPNVIQGGPGTGKTVVGLHRAALLVFRNRGSAPDSRILIVGPNRVFMQYIQYVLPQLGETSADQLAVHGLADITIAGYDDPRVEKVKGGSDMAHVLRAAVIDRVRPPSDDISFDDEAPRFTIRAQDISVLMNGFDPTRLPYMDARDRFREAFESLAISALFETTGSQGSATNVRSRPEFNRAIERMWPSITAEELVRQLLSSEERLERASSKVLSDVDRRLLYRKPVERIDDVVWTAGDVALVDEARVLLTGRPQTYWHVILDEAQDLTPMELRMVGRRVRQGALTVLGDLAQATGSWDYEEWEEIERHLGVSGAPIHELIHAYRVPRQIMQAALPILAQTAPATTPPRPYRDGEEEPRWIEVPRTDRARQAVLTAAERQRQGGTVAIIAPLKLIDEVRGELELSGAQYGDGAKGQLGLSIELVDPRLAKGLEFDHVVLVEPSVLIREHRDGRGLRELYVALTRPTRTLTCVHSERLPWPLGESTA